ncbi:MAG: lipoyl(octanoyl) transferase LipB [Burkholderiales bacterium]|nr:lipoyl(octanoyl) transferase LipB [Burkholderiales bacterium]
MNQTASARARPPDPAPAVADIARACARVEEPIIRSLGRVDYLPTWQAMQAFTAARGAATPDELWQVEHPPLYTVGIAGRPEHLPRAHNAIPVVRIDRGGQITYHGPGQVVLYTLLDLERRQLGVRALIRLLERAVIDWLGQHGVAAQARPDAPGVYVEGAKIAALGLRIRRGCSYHGIALNVANALAPFDVIDPCGYPGMRVTRAQDLGIDLAPAVVCEELTARVIERLNQASAAAP